MHKQIAECGTRALTVCVCDGKEEWILLDFVQAEIYAFMAQGHRLHTLISCDCVGSHTLDIHSTDFRLRHALHVIPSTQLSFPDFPSTSSSSKQAKSRPESTRFSTAIFHALTQLAVCKNEWKKERQDGMKANRKEISPRSPFLSFYISICKVITNGRFLTVFGIISSLSKQHTKEEIIKRR